MEKSNVEGPGGEKGKEKAAGLLSRIGVVTPLVAAAGIALLAGLFFLVNWLAAISIAGAVWVFADATLAKITRVRPSVHGARMMPVIWGVFGFVPLVGAGVYIYLRGALIARSAKDVARPGMTAEKMAEAGKLPPPTFASPGTAVMLAAVAFLVYTGWRMGPEITIEFGTGYEGLELTGTDPDNVFAAGSLVVKFKSRIPKRDCDRLDWELVREGEDGNVKLKDDTAAVEKESDYTVWMRRIRASKPGRFRVNVLDKGVIMASAYFTMLE